MHVLVVPWLDDYDMSLWNVGSNPAYVTFLVPIKQLWMSHSWSILPSLHFWALRPTCIHPFFIRNAFKLHSENMKLSSHSWYCGRVVDCSNQYGGSNLADCVFFFYEERQDWGQPQCGKDYLHIVVNETATLTSPYLLLMLCHLIIISIVTM